MSDEPLDMEIERRRAARSLDGRRRRVEAAIEALPRLIRVGPYDYEIVIWGAVEAGASNRIGQHSSMAHEICLLREQVSVVMFVDTFLHECLHALWYVWAVGEDDKQERTVTMLATGLTSLHRDNPWLAGWISTALGEG